MKISEYILGFAKILDSGELTRSTLKEDEAGLHRIVASVLRKSVHSEVMSRVADDFHAAYTSIAGENISLKQKIDNLEGKVKDDSEVSDSPIESTS